MQAGSGKQGNFRGAADEGKLPAGYLHPRSVGWVNQRSLDRASPGPSDGPWVAIGLAVLVLCSGCGALVAFLSFPWSGRNCSTPTSHYICSPEGQMVAATTPGWAALAGILIAAGTCALRRPWWIVGMSAGYVVAFAGFGVGWFIANAGQ
jgi:hypothetical protein